MTSDFPGRVPLLSFEEAILERARVCREGRWREGRKAVGVDVGEFGCRDVIAGTRLSDCGAEI